MTSKSSRPFGEDTLEAPSDAAPEGLAIGTIVGEFRIKRHLGEGGFGAVYEAEHVAIGRAAAVKVIHKRHLHTGDTVSRFLDEAKAASSLRSRYIVDVFSFGSLPDGRPFYVMELLSGESLASLLERGPMPLARALRVLDQVARALEIAHGAGIVHRDVKPDNVFVTRDEDGADQVKLLDFGLAKLTTDSTRGARTQPGFPMGTPNYMAPEQCLGQAVDARTDLYSFGVMAYELIVGELPFARDTVAEMLSAQLYATHPAPSSRCSAFGEAVDQAFKQLLAKDPKDRPESAREAMATLTEACSRLETKETPPTVVLARPTQATPAPTPLTLVTPMGPAPERTHWPYVLVLLLSVCAGATLAFFARRWESSSRSEQRRLEQPGFDEDGETPHTEPSLAKSSLLPLDSALLATSAETPSTASSSPSATERPSTSATTTGPPPTASKTKAPRPNRGTPTALENPFQ